MKCPVIINKSVCIDANVHVTPEVCVGDVQSVCVGEPVIEACSCNHCNPCCPCDPNDCVYMVKQMLCVQFPLTFSASVSVDSIGAVCNIPEKEICCELPPQNDCNIPDVCRGEAQDVWGIYDSRGAQAACWVYDSWEMQDACGLQDLCDTEDECMMQQDHYEASGIHDRDLVFVRPGGW